MKVVAIDYGEKRVGLAVSDSEGRLALGLPLYEQRGDGGDAERIAARVMEAGAERVVVGLPFNMDGSEGPAVARVRGFVEELVLHLDLPVDFWDERLTSEEAKGRLRGVPVSGKKRRDHTNTVSAQIILESYLQGRRR